MIISTSIVKHTREIPEDSQQPERSSRRRVYDERSEADARQDEEDARQDEEDAVLFA